MVDDSMRMLEERAKELQCVYVVDELLQNKHLTLPAALARLAETIPIGLTHPDAGRARLSYQGVGYGPADFDRVRVLHRAPLAMDDEAVGELAVGYLPDAPGGDSPFLDQEIKLIDTLARRISLSVLGAQRELALLMDVLHRIDPEMLPRIAEKLRVHLKNTVGARAESLFDQLGIGGDGRQSGHVNTPTAPRVRAASPATLGRKLIAGATAFLPQREMYDLLGGWIEEQRVLALAKMVDSASTGPGEILDAVRKYVDAVGPGTGASPTGTWLLAELAHRFLTDEEQVVSQVIENLRVADFVDMLERVIGSQTSRGNIGGKGAGLFIAQRILARAAETDPLLAQVRVPRTWYVATDQFREFIRYNNLEELYYHKYHSAFHLRMTYDNMLERFKSARLPPHTVRMLRMALEDLGDAPLIVRSSSLLEDRHGGAFSGKYKSLFLANQGSRKERLDALMDAVLEVYSSMYNPDALQYRRERGLLNITEQMGVLVQEVVGRRAGKYFLPAFAGVAFSHNVLRWSPRIKRGDGLVRMIMGLGTRAVDRVNDDYCVLFSPGQPGLAVNQTPEDIRHYAPKNIDLIDLEAGRFETVAVDDFLREAGAEMPGLHRYVSVHRDGFVETKNALTLDPRRDDMTVTFASVLSGSDFPAKIKRMLDLLADKLETPVDLEFAHDGENLYLLQCRPQGSGVQAGPAPIPQNLDPRDVVFTANRFISDGRLQDIAYVVYVDGDAYNALPTRQALLSVGAAVGLLNEALPRRKYILMGPGRWGSRGDVKLGVRVTYADISGTAALIEIAKEKHAYVPELSFGTHFFQDLVEAGIVYIPLYPDQSDVAFRSGFFRGGHNRLAEILPDHAHLSDVLRVIDVPAAYGGRTLSVHLNSELEQAVAFLREPTPSHSPAPASAPAAREAPPAGWTVRDEREHWRCLHYMARQIAEHLDMEAYGVKGVYLIGSAGTGETGIGSDIDLLLHVEDKDGERGGRLRIWLDGWSRALAKINYLQTGYDTDGLLDIHLVTDADIAAGDSFAVKIASTTDPATPLRLRG